MLHSSETLRHPFSITTFEDWVYWTDWDKEAVFRANKFTGKDVEAVTALNMVTNDYFLLHRTKRKLIDFPFHFANSFNIQ